MIPLGHQHIVEFLNCDSKILNDKEALENLLIQAIDKSELHVEKIISHKFDPVGVTVLAVISESHIGIHSYPESKHLSLDVFTCTDPEKNFRFIEYFKEKLKPSSVRLVQIQRGDSIEINRDDWITSSSTYGFDVRYHVKENLYRKESKFQLIEIIENENFGRMLFLDRDLQISEYDAHLYNEQLVKPVESAGIAVKNAAIMGGGDGGILNSVLKLNPDYVTLIDIDEDVINLSKKYLNKICENAFEDPRVTIHIEDVIKFIDGEHKFDAIICDLTMHPGAFSGIEHKDFLNLLFTKIKNMMNENGILTLQCGGEYEKENTELIKRALTNHFVEVKFHTSFIPSFCENWVFAEARK
ncbi:spermidine synthase [bacterium BMS3Abin03]|nr:spermidine synthase [bacterium BMS3Abin03]